MRGHPMTPDARQLGISASRLEFAMRRRGLNARTLASESGVAPSTLSRYLSGERLITAQNLILICPVLGVSADWVLGIDPFSLARRRERGYP